MFKNPQVIVLRTAGTNCDAETAYAFERFGADVDLIHINRLFSGEKSLSQYHILAIPGGFTYGDDIMAGRILANELRLRLGQDIREFIDAGKLIIGICNGFQVLVRAGLLPGNSQEQGQAQQTATLTNNDSGKFEDRWVHLKRSGSSVWTEGCDDIIYIPVAHAEGKFIPKDDDVLRRLQANGRIIFRYCTPGGQPGEYPVNPNGSVDHIAGICDPTGRILGMMPHPERHFLFEHHPSWTRFQKESPLGQGSRIFENGVNYVRNNLLKCPSALEPHCSRK